MVSSKIAALEACISTIIVGLIPILILKFIPIGKTKSGENKKEKSNSKSKTNTNAETNNINCRQSQIIKIFLSFAAGGLLGDIFLHLLPHIFDSTHSTHSHHHNHEHSHNHEHQIYIGLSILSGFFTFFIVDKSVRLYQSYSFKNHKPKLQFNNDNGVRKEVTKTNDLNKENGLNNESFQLRQRKRTTVQTKLPKSNTELKNNNSEFEFRDVEEHTPNLATSYLNIIADFTHNITDGLALGASFMSGQKIGFITFVAILFHEIPHELGDFAILIKAGFSRNTAIKIQFLTAIGSFIGTLISLIFGNILVSYSIEFWILPFTAGGFLYISNVTIIPELLDEPDWKQSLYEFGSIAAGI